MAGFGRGWTVAAVLLAVAVLAGVTVALWPKPARVLPPTRDRVYSAQRVCLLTGPAGLADPATAQVWGGLEDASVKSRAQVSYLSVAGVDTAANAAPYLASLADGRCDLVLAVGSAPVGAVALDAPKFPQVKFLVVGGGAARSNVTVLTPPQPVSPSATRAAVAAAVINR
jgi:basic membrane lipoprotein Med (substrate-binding protein (PBP1-ABC) superfamily)